MEARWARKACMAAAMLSLGAGYRTPNFVVQAPSDEIAAEVGQTAERLRRELAVEWLGQEMPDWTHPCPIEVQVGPHLGAGGATTFMFDRGEVFGWQMNVQGSRQRVLDSVLPHEVTHTVFASHFRQPLPRWADEGGSSTVEHESERHKQQRALVQYLKTRRGIPFSQMFAMKEYPRDILPLYAQGHSLATFLIAQGGKPKYLKFVGAGLRGEQWVLATREFYGYENLGVLQNAWLDWVRQGSRLPLPSAHGAADAMSAVGQPAPQPHGEAEAFDPLRRPMPGELAGDTENLSPSDPLMPVRGGVAAKSKPPAARGAQVSIYEGRARRDTLRR